LISASRIDGVKMAYLCGKHDCLATSRTGDLTKASTANRHQYDRINEGAS
jgi:hypothetical protein